MAFSLLSGALFVPTRVVQAGIFSSLFGDQVYADTETSATPPQSDDNLQNSALSLQANVSYTTETVDAKTNANISGNALKPAAGPSGISDGKDNTDVSSGDTSVYVVKNGDTISQIADMFGVSINTILAANDMKKGDKIKEGDVLFILPVSGIEHTVKKGETLKGIAKLYKVDVSDITQFNGIAEDAKLAIGDELIIPGADEMSDEGGDKPAPNLASSVAADKNYYVVHPLQILIGYFINPLPTGHKTQGLHGPGHRGIDIGAPTGTNIYASAPGVVVAVKTGCRVGQRLCGGGYGNMVMINHPNGTKTLYGHMSKVGTHIGDVVTQGEVIGYVGSTGHSTGPHLHFEVFNAKNPGADWSWANNQLANESR